MIEYSTQFWNHCHALLNGPIICEQCRTPRGFTVVNDKGKKGAPRQVRLALRDTKHGAFAYNLGLFCTRCKRVPFTIKPKRKDLDKFMNNLFEGVTNDR